MRRSGEIAALEGFADCARRENPRVVFNLRNNFNPKAMPKARLSQGGGGAGPALAEMKVPADDDRSCSEPRHQNLGDELFRAHHRDRRVKMNKNETCQPEPSAYRGFVLGWRQSKNDQASGEEVGGMRFEGQQGAGGGPRLRNSDSASDDRLMPEMQAVKISDCVDGA